MTASVPGGSNHEVTPRAGQGTFPRNARLLRHADFERVYKQGRRHFSASMTVFYWQRPEGTTGSAAKSLIAPGLRIGFTVSRALGGAVQRNRMKRRLREAVRLTRPAASADADVVINPKKSLLTIDFAAVVNEVSRAFVVIEQKLAGKTEPVEPGTRKIPKAEAGKPESDFHAPVRQTRRVTAAEGLQVGDFAHVSARMPLRSYLFGLRDGSGGAVRRGARRIDGSVAAAALPSVCAWRIRSCDETQSSPFDFAQAKLHAEHARSRATEDTLRNTVTLPDIQNPQHEPGSEKRLLLVFVLTFVVMLLFQPLLKKYMPQPVTPAQQNQATQTQPAAPTTPTATAVSAPPTPAAGVTKQGASETETVIENDLYRITFSNRGAQVKSWILKKFDNDAGNGPLDLVNPAAAEKFGYPLSLWTYDEGTRNKLSSAFMSRPAKASRRRPPRSRLSMPTRTWRCARLSVSTTAML